MLQPAGPAHASSRGVTRAITVDRVALACLLAVPLGYTLRYLPYYALGVSGRARDPLNGLLRPSGPLGISFGLAGAALFLFMWLYPLRKRLPLLRRAGNLGGWLQVHIAAGLALPFVVAVHAGWRFTGLIGLGFAAMVLVVLSGVVGRYLYSHIPRHTDGLELTREEVASERRALLTRIAAATGLDPTEIERTLDPGPQAGAGRGLAGTFVRLVAGDLSRRRAMRELARRWSRPRPGQPAPDPHALADAMRLARRELALGQQVRMLEATHRVFAWWHVAHLPVAITAFLAILVHVGVAVLIGGVMPR
jgi:hypothetical protein